MIFTLIDEPYQIHTRLGLLPFYWIYYKSSGQGWGFKISSSDALPCHPLPQNRCVTVRLGGRHFTLPFFFRLVPSVTVEHLLVLILSEIWRLNFLTLLDDKIEVYLDCCLFFTITLVSLNVFFLYLG